MRATSIPWRGLVAASLAVAVSLGADPAAAGNDRVGVNSAVNTDANGTPPGAPTRKLVIGQEVVHNERITTDANGQTQILFLDGSSISVGPNADLIIDEFVYDPATGTGKMTITAVQGAMRFVGGKLSKQDNAVTLHMGGSTIGVRGGVFVANVQRGGSAQVIFVYGKAVQVSGKNGCSAELYRPGYAVDINNPQGCPDAPHAAPPGAAVAILNQLDGRAGGNGGATKVPTEATVAASGVANTISNNVTASIQAATQNSAAPAAAATPPRPTASPPQVPTNQIQVVSAQSQLAVVNPTPPPPPAPPAPPAPPPSPPTPSFTPNAAGAFKIGTLGTNTGFTGQASGLPSAQLSYPDATLKNGSFVIASITSGQTGLATDTATHTVNEVVSVSPLNAGATIPATFGISTFTIDGIDVLHGTNTIAGITFTNGSATIAGQTINFAQPFATGPATTSPDGSFFYANMTFNSSVLGVDNSSVNAPLFIMGGTPVAQSFFQPSPTQQILAFSLQPDFALANGSQQQTIPFLPSFAGGTQANPVVSPLYIATQANSAFGSFNAVSNPTGTSPFFLQSSLAINGQGASQTAAFALTTGGFSTSSTFGSVVAGGPLRATFMAGGTSPLAHVGSSVTTVPDGNGNSLFGGNTISGFVLDQNKSGGDTGAGFSTATANAFQVGVAGSSTPYGFNQPALAASLPSGVGVNRTSSVQSGFFGGLMTTATGLPYVLGGQTNVTTNASNSTVGAVFVGTTDPSVPNQTGISTMTLPFGSQSGRNFGRSAFIDNNIYGATESANTPVQITTTGGATISYPTDSSGASAFPSLAMVTSATVPNAANGLLPAGVSFCSCQFLQWGYWTGHIPASNQGGPSNTTQSAYINTWLAGTPTVTMPTTGQGSFSGAAIGTVSNAGNNYLAAGGFNSTYNFGSNTGTVTISNFDGKTFSGTVHGAGNQYAGNLAGSGLAGLTTGGFFGPNAVETGGTFGVHAVSGPSYLASGIFAGR
jgi:hypothetical protein